MTVPKRLWISRCMAEICETSPDSLAVYIHGTEDPEQYKKIKDYLWTEGIMDEIIKSRLGISLDATKSS